MLPYKPGDVVLQVLQLTKQFESFKAVDGLSFEARAGEVFGLLGPNGAGKTTTIRLISTMLAPTSGTAIVCGQDIRQHPEAVRHNIGILTTDMGAYDRLTGRENLRYFGALHSILHHRLDQRIEELRSLLQMSEFIDRRAGTYSTGMKQKLSIARAVLHDPPIVVLDEPTAGLDVLASQTVLQFVGQARRQGKLIVLSTHHMPDAERMCDRAAIMHHGRMVAVQSVPELKQQTNTQNLEDAFLALVKEHEEPASVGTPEKGKAKRRRLFRILIGLGIVAAAFIWERLQR